MNEQNTQSNRLPSAKGGFAAMSLCLVLYFGVPKAVQFVSTHSKTIKQELSDFFDEDKDAKIENVKKGVFQYVARGKPTTFYVVKDQVGKESGSGCLTADCFIFKHNPKYKSTDNDYDRARPIFYKLNGKGHLQPHQNVKVPVIIK